MLAAARNSCRPTITPFCLKMAVPPSRHACRRSALTAMEAQMRGLRKGQSEVPVIVPWLATRVFKEQFTSSSYSTS